MRRIVVFTICIAGCLGMTIQCSAQVQYDFWVLLSDKTNSPYSLTEPAAFLSERAIQRRTNQSISLDQKDIPVDPAYLQELRNIPELDFKYASKWFNAAVIRCDSSILPSITALPFVTQIKKTISLKSEKETLLEEVVQHIGQISNTRLPIAYGLSANQIMDLNGQALHDQGYQGEGMVIAILDSGFDNVDSMSSFTTLFQEGRILSTHDFVEGDVDVYDEHSHGRYVLSCIAGIKEGEAYGTAVNASFHLLRTEDVDSETHVEEYNWIAGAEYADSTGADVLNTSLGYTIFDSLQVNYTYEDMDGNTAWITQGADIAASRGMLVVNSAGNSANSEFHYIGAPADGDSVLAVGSVRADSLHSGFSSFGPSFDGRVKPNVCAQGSQAIGINGADEVVAISGTSFSSPILAGLATCLWQAVPGATNMEVFGAIEMSADHYLNPNDSLGYGIPDFGAALFFLQEMVGLREIDGTNIQLFPNPVSDYFRVILNEGMDVNELRISAWDIRGAESRLNYQPTGARHLRIDSSSLSQGMYFLRITSETGRFDLRFVKE